MAVPGRRRAKHCTTTLDERLSSHVQRAREQVELVPPGEERDALVQKLREIEGAIFFHRLLGTPKSN
jgi:hypothetical protein